MFARSNCHQWTPHYLDYVMDRLPAPQYAALEDHLSGCAACRREVAEYRQALTLAAAAGRQPHPASQASWQELRWRLEQETTPETSRSLGLFAHRRQLAGAGLALTALTGAVVVGIPHWTKFAGENGSVLHPNLVRSGTSVQPQPVNNGATTDLQPRLLPTPLANNTLAIKTPGKKTSVLPQIGRALSHPPVQIASSAAATPLETRSGISRRVSSADPEVKTMQEPGAKSIEPTLAQVPALPALTSVATTPPKPGQRKPSAVASVEVARETTQAVAQIGKGVDDLVYLNAPSVNVPMQETGTAPDKTRRIEMAVTRLLADVQHGDDFVAARLPQIAGRGNRAVQAAVQAYQQEQAIVDTRLARKVRLGVKGMALSELCRRLADETGIMLKADARVGDDNVTLFCNPRPLRDIMRQLSEHFGFQWMREGQDGAYHYELTQSMRSQLREEEMRNEDQDEALIALDKAMEKYRRFRGLNVTQIRELGKIMKPEDAIELFPMTQGGWLPANLYFGLSPDDMQTLRSGQPLTFGMSPENGGRTLPPVLQPEILKSFDDVRINPHPGDSGPLLMGHNIPADSLPLSAAQQITSTSELHLDRSQLGTFTLKGEIFLNVTTPDGSKDGIGHGLTFAEVTSPAVSSPQNALANAKRAHDPDLQPRVTLAPQASCKLEFGNLPDEEGIGQEVGPKCTTGDVLEAIFKATGKDVIGDFYTRLYAPGKVTEQNATLFNALNHVADTIHERWTRDSGWLKFRSTAWFYDRPKEVPARKLARWAASRKAHGAATIDDLSEIAQLSNTQLDALTTYQGALARYDLQEWNFARSTNLREHWRLLGLVPAEQRQEVATTQGLHLDRLPLALQKRFLPLLLHDPNTDIRPGNKEVAKTSLRIEYPAGHLPTDTPNLKPLMPSNPVIFLYKYGEPEKDYGQRTSIIGPFNAIIGGSEAMTEQRRERKG